MIDFRKVIFDEIKRRKLTINKVAVGSKVSPPNLYKFHDGGKITHTTLERLLDFLGAELRFKK